jgi:chemoreceptor-like protein with four helix bundle sensory module
MFRKELLIFSGLAILVFLIVAGAASMAVRAVQRDGTMLAKDTLPGLVSAGEAMSRMDENWFNLHLLLSLESPAERESLIRKISDNSTEPIWRVYEEAVFDKEDEQLFQEMKVNRAKFLEARTHYFNLVQAGDIPAAKEFFAVDLKSAFDRYRDAAATLFKLNAAIGRARADRLIKLSSWTPYALAAFCVTVLLVGVFVGFKASLGAFIGVWSEGTHKSPGSR